MSSINIDFSVYDNHDPRTLSILDYSTWGIIEEKPAIIEIVPAGFSKPIVYYFQKGKNNIFNTYNLHLQSISECGLSDLDELPDGIYIITVKGSPDKYYRKKYHLRTTKFKLELDKAYINLNLTCDTVDSKKEKELVKIELFLKAAEANLRASNVETAQELFLKAKTLLQNYENIKC